MEDGVDYRRMDADAVIAHAEPHGYFVNDSTLEVELFAAGMGEGMKTVIEAERLPLTRPPSRRPLCRDGEEQSRGSETRLRYAANG